MRGIARGARITVLVAAFAAALGSSSGHAFDRGHGAWAEILKRYTEDGFVDYAALKESRTGLDDYLADVESVPQKEYEAWPDPEKIAFWINAYNALTVQVILDHYPVRSIKAVPGAWTKKRFEALGMKWSLNQIEHDILRKQFQEPRVHFALVCASLGCPDLKSEPYQADHLGAQLDEQVRNFLMDENKARYDEMTDTLRLSPIFKWYREDFEQLGSVIPFLTMNRKDYLPLSMEGKITPKTKVTWLGYDWGLNDTDLGPPR